jgi:hypothetical protein
MHRLFLATVRVGYQTIEEGVAITLVGLEVTVCVCQVASIDVLLQTTVLVGTNSIAFLTVDVLCCEVLCVDGTHDVETVAVVSDYE